MLGVFAAHDRAMTLFRRRHGLAGQVPMLLVNTLDDRFDSGCETLSFENQRAQRKQHTTDFLRSMSRQTLYLIQLFDGLLRIPADQ